MFKNRLQELCQQRQWPLPEYTATRDGPDHNPRFAATVTVDGRTFDAPDLSRSFKEAHNKAARAAIDALTPVPPPPAPAPLEGQLSYKSQLQNLSMKRNLIPTYRCVREGPPHNLRFKATVEVDGQTFESQEFYKTLRDAEHDAARIALLALPPEESQHAKDEPGFYKNLLQQLAQKEGLPLPVYRTVRDDESHLPIFSSTVEVEGEIFHGDAARTKKQAEMNAAKVAWCQLKDRRSKVAAKPTWSNHVINNLPVPATSPSTVKGPKHRTTPSGQMIWVKKSAGKEDSSSVSMALTDRERLSSAIANITIVDDQKADSSDETVDCVSNSTTQSTSPSKMLSEVLANREHSVGCIATTKIADDQEADSSGETVVDHVSSSTILPPSLPKMVYEVLANREDSMDSTSSEDGLSSNSAESSSCSLNCNRVKVYPRKPDMVLPQGVTLLPFSDDKWVAVSLDFSKQSGDVLV